MTQLLSVANFIFVTEKSVLNNVSQLLKLNVLPKPLAIKFCNVLTRKDLRHTGGDRANIVLINTLIIT